MRSHSYRSAQYISAMYIHNERCLILAPSQVCRHAISKASSAAAALADAVGDGLVVLLPPLPLFVALLVQLVLLVV
jgi:hypothetical protein